MDLHLEKKKSLKLKIPFSKRNLILPSVNLPLSDNVLTIGFDTEFKQISEEQTLYCPINIIQKLANQK